METKLNNVARLHAIVLCLALTVTAINGCNKENLAPPLKNNSLAPNSSAVWIENGAFMPPTITVLPNTLVQWTNRDNVAYTVTSNSQLFASGNLTTGATFTYLFSAPGTFYYHSLPDTGMKGVIVVSSGVTGTSGNTGVSGVIGAQP